MVERIKHVMEFYKLSPATFAEQIGINRSNLTHLFSGRNQPSLELAKKILHCYPEIKTEWLIMGVGEMLRNNEDKELIFKLQNEKKVQKEPSELDLFAIFPNKSNIDTVQPTEIELTKEIKVPIPPAPETAKPKTETHTSIKPETPEEKICPSALTVSKIVFFYSDNSFEMFYPNK